jgi:hypothetical protein
MNTMLGLAMGLGAGAAWTAASGASSRTAVNATIVRLVEVVIGAYPFVNGIVLYSCQESPHEQHDSMYNVTLGRARQKLWKR